LRPKEAKYIREVLSPLAGELLSPCLNIGSQTHEFTLKKPHIDQEVFAPLRGKNVRIYNIDLQDGEGVDLAGDVLDPAFQAQLKAMTPKLVICSNVLEHLTDPLEFASVCATLVDPGGFLLISVPYSYPYHRDPIDNMLRMGPDRLKEIFPHLDRKAATIIADATFLQELRAKYKGLQMLSFLMKQAISLPKLLFTDFDRFKGRFHRYLWLFRPYEITVALFQRPFAQD
jgi:SAM-dependent methyltransferase